MRAQSVADRLEHSARGLGLGPTCALQPVTLARVVPVAQIGHAVIALARDRDAPVLSEAQGFHATISVGSDATQSRTS